MERNIELRDGKYYWWDGLMFKKHGPFNTEREAKLALVYHAEKVKKQLEQFSQFDDSFTGFLLGELAKIAPEERQEHFLRKSTNWVKRIIQGE